MSYQELTIDDISKREEDYVGLIPLIAPALLGAGAIVGGGQQRKRDRRDAQSIEAAHAAQRAEYERTKGRVDPINVKGRNCDELESMLANVVRQLSDRYNLNESQVSTLNSQKSQLENSIRNARCSEQRAQASAMQVQSAESQLAAIKAAQKAKMRKTLTYVGIGVGGLILTIVLIKVLKS